MANRYFIRLSYNGRGYHGWQIQENATSVQQVLQEALGLLLKESINVVGCGRTDTGVHARDFYAHFDVEKPIENPSKLIYRLNALLPFDIAIRLIYKVSNKAHARFDAISRTYRYFIHQTKQPFCYETSFFVPQKLNIDQMNTACFYLIGKHNFQSFSKVRTDIANFICDVKTAKWTKKGEVLIFEITANRFLRNMVRAIVGTLLDVGLGKISPDEFLHIIQQKNRNKAGTSVPAKALFLEHINY